MERYGIKTILDLRRMDRPCKKKGKKTEQLKLAGRYMRKVCPEPRCIIFPSQDSCAFLHNFSPAFALSIANTLAGF